MKKLFSSAILIVFLLTLGLIIILSTLGIETSRFNNFATKQISQFDKDLNLRLNTIKFKLDIREISLFLLTEKPKINFKEIEIPTKSIKVYVDFLSIFKSEINVKKLVYHLMKLR